MEEENDAVYANFQVCPLTKEGPGAMQLVCVESARHVVRRGEP